MELCETDLFKILMGKTSDNSASSSHSTDTNHGLTEQEISIVMRKVLEGLVECHRKNIIHRDLKAANLLLTSAGLLSSYSSIFEIFCSRYAGGVKICDFGVSGRMKPDEERCSFIGSPYWMAPEVRFLSFCLGNCSLVVFLCQSHPTSLSPPFD